MRKEPGSAYDKWDIYVVTLERVYASLNNVDVQI
jgi:hypothetical protein